MEPAPGQSAWWSKTSPTLVLVSFLLTSTASSPALVAATSGNVLVANVRELSHHGKPQLGSCLKKPEFRLNTWSRWHPPFVMRKDSHIYVIHVAMVRSAHASSTFPMVTSRELTRFRHFTSFGDAFRSELGDDEMVHRRDIEPAFLQVAAEVYRAVSMRAQAASVTTSPRPASGGTSVSAPTAVSSTDDVSTSDALLPYPLLHDSNYFNHEASGRKHARMLPSRVAREAT